MAHDLALPAVTFRDRDLYYSESRRFAALLGVPASALSPDWAGFAVNDAARAIAAKIFAGTGVWVCAPAGTGP